MTSAESNNSQFDDLLLAIGSEIAGERTKPVSLDEADEDLQRRVNHARECLLLLQAATREYSAGEFPTEPSEFLGNTASSGILAPSRFQRFHIIRRLGVGGFAEVFLADDPLLHRQVAIKIPHTKWVADPNARRRFLREARALGQMQHPAIVTVFESGELDGIPFLVMEHCDAGNLDQYLSGLPQRQHPRVCASLVHQIAEGLSVTHKLGILHRDIKLRNVLLAVVSETTGSGSEIHPSSLDVPPEWRNIQPKLSDFGLAKWLDEEFDAQKTQSGFVAGTLQYMAPEQAAGKTDQISPATDVHGLGVILYEMLTGQSPFAGDTQVETSWNILNKEQIAVRTLRPAVPRDLETICHKALEKDPSRRYPSALEMAEDLRRFLDDREILAKPVSKIERAWRWCRHHPELAALLLVVCFSISLISMGGWWYSNRLAETVKSETKLRESESHLLEESERRELVLMQKTEELTSAIQREQLMTYVSRMRQAQDLYDHGEIVDYASLLSAMRPGSPQETDLRDFAWRLMTAKCGGEIRPFEVTRNDDFYSVNVIPEKNRIVAGTNHGAFYAWDLRTGEYKETGLPAYVEHTKLCGVAYQPQQDAWFYAHHPMSDQQKVESSKLKYLRASDGMSKTVAESPLFERLSHSPDRSRFCLEVGGRDFRQFQVFSVTTGEHLWTAQAGRQDLNQRPAWGPDGTFAVPMFREVALYSPNGGPLAKLSRDSTDELAEIRSVAISADGLLLAGLRTDLTVDLWKRSPGEPFVFDSTIRVHDRAIPAAEEMPGRWHDIQFLNANAWLAFSGPGNRVFLWNLKTKRVDSRSPVFQNPLASIIPLPDDTLLLHESTFGLYRWKPTADGPVLAGHAREAWAVEYSPDGRFLASGSDDGTMKIWEVASGRELATSLNHSQTVVQTRFSPAGTRVASLCLDGSLRVWEFDPKTGLPSAQHREVDEHRKGRSLCWSADGRLIATGGNEGEVVLWDANTLQVVRRFQDHEATVRQILFLEGDRTLLTVSTDSTVCIRDLAVNDRVIHKWGEEFDAYCVALLPDGDTLAVGQGHGVISLRSRASGKLIGSLTGHRNGVFSMQLSPDGKVLATGDESGNVRFWRTENHQPLLSLRVGDHKANALAFPPQGDALAIATHDGKVTLWRAPFVQDVLPTAGQSSPGSHPVAEGHDRPVKTKPKPNESSDTMRDVSTTALDISFGAKVAGKFTVSFGDGMEEARCVLIQSDGKVIVGGESQNASNHDFALARFHVNGTFDSTFGVGGKVTTPIGSGTDIMYGLTQLRNGKIVAVGYRDAGGTADIAVVRYQNDGTLDPSFGIGGIVITAVSAKDDAAFSVVEQNDGKLLVAGYATGDGTKDFGLFRYNIDGSLDTTFDHDGIVMTPFGGGTDIGQSLALQPDGKIVVAGHSHNGGNYDFALARYHADGSLDTSFDGDGKVTTAVGPGNDLAFSLGIQGDGKIVMGGEASDGSLADFALVRYHSDGSLDTTFDGDGKIALAIGDRDDVGHSVELLDDGKILLAGTTDIAGQYDVAVVRFNTDGTLDTTFDGDGKKIQAIGALDDYGFDVAAGRDGKIVVAGNSNNGENTDFAVARFNSDGTLDSSFDHDGPGRVVTSFGINQDEPRQVIIANGKIVVAGFTWNGSDWDLALARFNRDGTLDKTFDEDGKLTARFGSLYDMAHCVAAQRDGKLVVAGYSNNGKDYDFAVARYNLDGSLDSTFDGDGKLTTDFENSEEVSFGVAIQDDGKIVVAGYAVVGPAYDFALTRYNEDGSLDTTFDGDGKVTTAIGSSHDLAFSLVLQNDGKIVVAGSSISEGRTVFALARYRTDGSLDPTFDGDGRSITEFGVSDSHANSIALQGDGKIIAAGPSSDGFSLARYDLSGSLDTTFSEDGKLTTLIGSGGVAYSVAVQGDGKIVVAGDSSSGEFAVVRYKENGDLDRTFDGDGLLKVDIGASNDAARSLVAEADGTITVAGYSSYGSSSSNFALIRLDLNEVAQKYATPNGLNFEIDRSGLGSGQLIQRPNDTMDGLNQLQVAGIDFAMPFGESGTTKDDGRTFVTSTVNLAGLDTHREVTVPNTGSHGFARTLDAFTNTTNHPISTTVKIIGNLGTDAATTVFGTSDGDMSVETSDRWIGTDDADGEGSPAIIHHIHGSAGLRPTDLQVVKDRISWTYLLTVPPKATVRLCHLTVQAKTRSDAIAAANALISPTGFGGQSAAFLTPVELESLVNVQFNRAPTDIVLSGSSIDQHSANGAVVGQLTAADPNAEWEQFSYSLVDDADGRFAILGDQLIVADGVRLNHKGSQSHQIVIRVADAEGMAYEKSFTIQVMDKAVTP
ncbi:MAG: protein kinase [Planctomycetaceae bacterium]